MTFPVFASGDVLRAADMNAVGSWLVKTQTIGSAVSSVTVTDAFSAQYENYIVTVSGGAASTSNYGNLTLGATSTGYYVLGYFGAYNVASLNAYSVNNGASFSECCIGSTSDIEGWFYIGSPNLAKPTHVRIFNAGSITTGNYTSFYQGFLNNTTQYTAFTITVTTGTFTGGTIRVYGLRP